MVQPHSVEGRGEGSAEWGTKTRRTILLSESPADLLDRPLADYPALLVQLPETDRAIAERVDYALRHHLLRLLRSGVAREELLAAYDSLRRLVPAGREEEFGSLASRWRGYADLLDTQLASVESRDPKEALALKHAGKIVETVEREPGLTQTELAAHLHLKPANLSRILGILEANGLLVRRTEGVEKRLFPMPFAVAGKPGPRQERWMLQLAREKVA